MDSLIRKPFARDFYRESQYPTGEGHIHESEFRAYHILHRTKQLLEDGVPHGYILMLIDMMEGGWMKGGWKE